MANAAGETKAHFHSLEWAGKKLSRLRQLPQKRKTSLESLASQQRQCLCVTGDRKGQLCQTHGGKPCSVGGCTTKACARGLCVKHGGGKKPCSVAGCTTASKRSGLCAKHGGGERGCVFGGCTNKMVGSMWKTCGTHGGLGYCAYSPECLTPARTWGGNCHKHTSKQTV